ncbi:ankyrin [Apiospora saccharicola]|uniref:Ankyrin n=1 Tax=Apiospora saccharicola TaxID=335842 RepID=A0ABR1TQE8_9PEZI
MADPLSIAASIAGVVTLADLVFGRLYKYTKTVKDAPAEVKQLTTLVNDLGGLLNSLARLARALEGERFDVSLRMQHVDACNFVLASLDKLLQKAEKDLAKPGQLDRIQRKLKWPFSTSQIKEYLAELSTHKDNIVLALTADTMNGLLQSLSFERKLIDTTDEILQDVRETRKITTRIEESSERTKVLKAFLKHNPQENYDMSLSLRHPRTGLWLLRLPPFQTWLDTPGSKLWLSGIPGAGKTVLAASVIEAALARSNDKVAVAFYFCDYKTEATWNPSTILSVIAAQLALQSEEAYKELASFYDQLHPPNGLPRSPRILELTMALSTMTDRFDQVFIIVDALDECGEHTTSVVEILASYANDHDNVCAALLSRDEDEIRFRLGDDFENLEIAAHSEDVAEYVSSEIQERVRDGRLRVGDNDLLADIQRTLVDKAHGM